MNPPKKIFILCYNAVLEIKTENYSDSTFEIFKQYLESDFNIPLIIEEFKSFFLSKKSQSISEYDILKDYFLQKNIIINDNRFDDILYKLRVADRNELRINRNLKDILKKIQNQYDLILISSHIKQFVERELKMFGLSDFFKEIIYTHNAETVELLKNQTVISNLEQLNIQ